MDKGSIRFSVKLDKEHVMDLDSDLNVDKASINEALAKQPSLFAWYGMIYELAKARTSEVRSKIDTHLRNEAAKSGEKLSEAKIEAVIDTNEIYIKAKRDEGMLLICKQAFEQRKDMLISLASNMRSEMDDELKILKDKAKKAMGK